MLRAFRSTCCESGVESCLVMLQALARQETERANTAETEVARLEQAVHNKSSEGRGWQQQLHQAQQDLLAAQVLPTLLLCSSLWPCTVCMVCY